jgi:hypothetical protein
MFILIVLILLEKLKQSNAIHSLGPYLWRGVGKRVHLTERQIFLLGRQAPNYDPAVSV